MNRALTLVFARDVGSPKIVEALSAVDGASKEVLADFSETLLKACGPTIKKVSHVTFGVRGE